MPEGPVLLHVSQVHTLFVIHEDLKLTNDLIASEVVLGEGQLLDLVGSVEAIDHGRVGELSLLLDVVEAELLER